MIPALPRSVLRRSAQLPVPARSCAATPPSADRRHAREAVARSAICVYAAKALTIGAPQNSVISCCALQRVPGRREPSAAPAFVPAASEPGDVETPVSTTSRSGSPQRPRRCGGRSTERSPPGRSGCRQASRVSGLRAGGTAGARPIAAEGAHRDHALPSPASRAARRRRTGREMAISRCPARAASEDVEVGAPGACKYAPKPPDWDGIRAA